MKWTSVQKGNPELSGRVLLVVNNTIILGYYVRSYPLGYLDENINKVEPEYWGYLDDIPMPEKDCTEPCELCKNRHAAYHIPK